MTSYNIQEGRLELYIRENCLFARHRHLDSIGHSVLKEDGSPYKFSRELKMNLSREPLTSTERQRLGASRILRVEASRSMTSRWRSEVYYQLEFPDAHNNAHSRGSIQVSVDPT